MDDLDADPEQKYRLKLLLSTLFGEMFVEEACDELGVGPTQFAQLRKQMLRGALDGITPKPGGRPRKTAILSEDEIAALRARNAELERVVARLQAQLEVALLPLLRRTGPPGRPRLVRPAVGDARSAPPS